MDEKEVVRYVSEAVSRRQQNSILKRVHTINQTIRRKRYVVRVPASGSTVSCTSATSAPEAYILPAIPAPSVSPPSSAGSDTSTTPHQSPSVEEHHEEAAPAPAVPAPERSDDTLIEAQTLASRVERPFAGTAMDECLGHRMNIVPTTADADAACATNKDLLTVSLPSTAGSESATGSATSSTSSFSPQLGVTAGDARSGSDSGTFPSISEGDLEGDQMQAHASGTPLSCSAQLCAKSSVPLTPLSPPVFDEKGSCVSPLSALAASAQAQAGELTPEPPRPARPHSTSVPPLPVAPVPAAPTPPVEQLRACGSQREKQQAKEKEKEKERSKGIANVLDFFLPSKSKGSYSFNKSASLSSADDASVSGGTSPLPGNVPTLTHVAPIKSTPEHSVSSHKSGALIALYNCSVSPQCVCILGPVALRVAEKSSKRVSPPSNSQVQSRSGSFTDSSLAGFVAADLNGIAPQDYELLSSRYVRRLCHRHTATWAT